MKLWVDSLFGIKTLNPKDVVKMTENFGIKLRSFASKILYFNGLYKLPIAQKPTLEEEAKWQRVRLNEPGMSTRDAILQRLADFRVILEKEIDEVEDIMTKVENPDVEEAEILTDIADWLNDITVYCSSENARYGIPSDEVLSIIMDSNFSKLDANGNPIYDSNGKVSKGPFYWKPEPKIRELLEERMKE